MSGELERLIYASQATRDYPSLQSIAGIVEVSDRNNRQNGVTGALVLADGVFLQVLEGAASDIELTLSRLLRDPRHTDLQVLQRHPVGFRQFEGWGLVGAALEPTRQSVMDELIGFAQADPDYVVDRVRTLVADQASREAGG